VVRSSAASDVYKRQLLNNLAGHIGVLRDWSPWWAAASPSLVYLALSLVAFQWLVRHR
jgi:lipopolysaccharide export system permease protein